MNNLSMDMTISYAPDEVPVTILQPHGNLDRFTYLDLIHRSKEVYDSGQRYLILDMSDITNVGISGLYGLYSIAMIFRGEEPLEPEGGWAAVRSMASHLEGTSQYLKLLRPQSYLRKVLSNTGLPIYDDLAKAIASF